MTSQYGDSILIHYGEDYTSETSTKADENNFNILIDVGKVKSDATIIKQNIETYLNNDVDLIILTHPDSDHIGGFGTTSAESDGSPGYVRISDYNVKQVLYYGYKSSTKTAQNLYARLNYLTENNEISLCRAYDAIHNPTPICPTTYFPGTELSFQILDTNHYIENKESEGSGDPNDTSIATIFNYTANGKLFKYLTTGDLEIDGINGMLSHEENIELIQNSTIYKAGHHGSDNANSLRLLQIVNPNDILISAACSGDGDVCGNTKHPNPITLARINKIGKLEHTYLNMTMGSIVVDINTQNQEEYTIHGLGATKLDYPASAGVENADEKDLPLYQTYLYSNMPMNNGTTFKKYVDENTDTIS